MNWPDLLALDLRLVGLLLVGLGIAHGFFDRHFGWRRELSKVSLFTRQVFYVHHFFIALIVAMNVRELKARRGANLLGRSE